ncbi:MAG TPA: OB-fold domain-containing protein [Acidimicrobiia bacterium]|nr:OB-fold domain-containing protein [Acidimicrobiia bacterium]
MSGFPERPGRVLPTPVGLNAEFYERAATTGRLHFQRCDACGRWRHPPRFRCAGCGSELWSWSPASGRGRVFSWTVTHRPVDPAFAAELPYAVLVVEMDEGVRVVGSLIGLPPGQLELDLPVVAELEIVAAEVALVHFRPVGPSPGPGIPTAAVD